MMLGITELLISLLLTPLFCVAQKGSNFTDYSLLLSFKSHLISQNPNKSLLRNWDSKTHFCKWVGVTCSDNLLDQRVVSLNLSGFSLAGVISPEISNLTQLIALDLSHNNLSGSLPSELGSLRQLKSLNVTGNSLEGSVPPNLSHCQNLEELCISDTMIKGAIPQELGFLSKLKFLRLNNNNLTGKIPSSLGNLSSLQYLYLHENDLYGEIPSQIGNLGNLKLISFRGNGFTGQIPYPIFNISALEIVDMSINRLSGELPQSLEFGLPNLQMLFLDSNRISGEMPVFLSNSSSLSYLYFTENDLQGKIPNEYGGLLELVWLEFEYNRISGGIPQGIFNISSLQVFRTRHNYLSGELPNDLGAWLPNLQEIFLSHNQFTGEISPSIANASKIVYLEVANNSFSGQIPMMLGNILDLEHLNLQNNLFVNNPNSIYLDFITSLENCRKLEYFIPSHNPLNGIIPDSIGNLSSVLKVIDADSTKVKGKMPETLGNLSSLTYLGLGENDLQGDIPLTIVGLQNLERLYLNRNKFEGHISAELCSLKRLGIMDLGGNMFSESIPVFLENLTELREVSLAFNRFQGNVPLTFWKLVNLEKLSLSGNLLQGSIPPELGNLKALYIVDLSSNDFSGDIPNSLGNLQSLVSLDMSNNSLRGLISNAFGNLIVLEFLDLSSNALSGTIPDVLETLRDLQFLNLSFNNLEGEIPRKGVFANLSHQSIMGNPRLCGPPELQLPSCTSQASKPKVSRVLTITIPVIAVTLFLVMISLFALLRRRKNVESLNVEESTIHLGHQVITYRELQLGTANFSEANLLGSGSSSKVYKGTLSNSDGRTVAIKVFNMQWEGALRNFDSECEVLCNVRHRNLLKIISVCSNLDFKALVLDYMPNGSLDKWLYSNNNYLNIVERLDVAVDVAMAMEYLHHDCLEPVVHCDLKPSNVLLDADMTAHVADFGITKILAQDQAGVQTRTLGTIGYIAPEYGLDGHVSTKGDVYSFGILLLELFTRKRPTDEMFHEDLSLPQWVMKSFPDALTEFLDSSLLTDIHYAPGKWRNAKDDQEDGKSRTQIEHSLLSVFEVALSCVKDSPEDRLSMREVVSRLKMIESELKWLKSLKVD